MTTALRNGLIVALAHVAIVGGVGGKLLRDRATYPRAWALTAPVDPDLPIRGRYVRLGIEARIDEDLVVPGGDATETGAPARVQMVRLAAAEGRLVARPAASGDALAARLTARDGEQVATLTEPVAFFIPEGVADPSQRPLGEQLWVEVTVPPSGPPRPIRLGVMRDGSLTSLDLR